MKYINKKTGVLIDTPSKITGGDWVTEAEYKKNKTDEEAPKEEVKKTAKK